MGHEETLNVYIELSSVPGYWQHERWDGSRYENGHKLTDNVGIIQEIKAKP